MEKLSTNLKNSAIISVRDLERIKRQAQFTLENDEAMSSKGLRLISAESKAKEHKDRIIAYDKSKVKVHIEESEEDKRIATRNREICNKAHQYQLKSTDAVKAIDKMILYAKTATVRDRQIKEKEVKEAKERKKEEKQNLQNELIRLKEMSRQEEELALIKQRQRDAGKVIIHQIKEREKERVNEVAQKGKEYKEMMTEVKRIQDEDIMALQKKKSHLEEIMKDMKIVNEKSIQMKKYTIQREREKDIELHNYNIEKAKKEEERVQQLKQIAKERELQLQKLREAQEKEYSKQSELDALRAQRAFESNERIQREKQLNEARMKQMRLNDLIESNTKMIKFKQMKLCLEGIKEKEDYDRVIKEQIAAHEADKSKKENERKLRQEHNFQLRKQIKCNEEARDLEKRENIEEGRKVRIGNDEFKKEIEAIKQERIEYLKSLNVKSLYIADLERFNTADI